MICPICNGEVPAESKTPPFCGSRCRLIDLGNWLGGKYAIAGDERVGEPGLAPLEDPDDLH